MRDLLLLLTTYHYSLLNLGCTIALNFRISTAQKLRCFCDVPKSIGLKMSLFAYVSDFVGQKSAFIRRIVMFIGSAGDTLITKLISTDNTVLSLISNPSSPETRGLKIQKESVITKNIEAYKNASTIKIENMGQLNFFYYNRDNYYIQLFRKCRHESSGMT